ncbi:Tricorn protease [Photobacterium proteolyticum]|uniref:Tricorn protease homolog n=1 Tax=Photobacterium proteolyticum TaxID=1903952 RepID=A0A1Q9GLW5_9GAMM|nr:S41 family peptidase [Photobacterium proteolyticum]OLQ75543.1 Tricorn protease [Photobacterium proteolyticum]
MRPFARCSLLAALIASSLSPALATTTSSSAEPQNQAPLWLRNTAISPDGKQLAFTYQSRIYLASSDGGNARAITSGEFYPHALVWSPDNKTLAFAANPYGNDDVFTVSLQSGEMSRLTSHSANDIPTAFSDNGKSVLFNTTRLTAEQQDFYSLPLYSFGTRGNQLYRVNINNKAAQALMPIPAKHAVWNAGKTQLLYNSPHKDQQFRKHQNSFAVPTIWLFDAKTGKHRQLTENRIAAQQPLWNSDNSGFYFLSERSGSFNVWFYELATGKEIPITTLADHPVRHLSVSANDDLAFSYNGELYRLAKNQVEPQKLAINIRNFAAAPSQLFYSNDATRFMPSVFDAEEILFSSYGDIYAMNTRNEKVKRLTHTATEEKQMVFTPDGYGVLYSAMRNGHWGLYLARSFSEEEMLSSTAMVEEQPFLVMPGHDISQPVYSPDSRKLAFVIDGRALHVIDLDNYDGNTPQSADFEAGPSLLTAPDDADTQINARPGTGKELIAADMVSESNRLEFVWSPDSTQLAVHLSPRPYVEQIYVVDAEGNKAPVNVSQNGFYNGKPKWSQDNRILTWTTSKFGLKTADGEDWDETVTGIFTNNSAMQDFKNDRELPEETEHYPFSASNLEYREAFHLPFSSQVLETHLLGDHLLVIDLMASPSGDETTRGFLYNVRTAESHTVFTDLPMASDVYITADQSFVYLLADGEVFEVDTATGDSVSLPIDLPVDYQEAPRKLAAYRQFVRQTQEMYYRPDMGNVDWAFYSEHYQRFLPHINNDRDFVNVLKELSGELNASHTGAYAMPANTMREDATAEIGLIFDQHVAPASLSSGKGKKSKTARREGLTIHSVLPGGPADNDAYGIKPGDRLVALNNRPINTLGDLASALNNKADQPVALTLQRGNDNTRQQRITPIDGGEAYSLIMKRWEIARRNYVSQQTGGKVGYVYLPDMSNASFLHLRSEALGRLRNADALIVDVRFNGGGFLADTLIEFLTARKAADIVPHIGQPTSDASRRSWLKPSVVIANSGSYSEASAFSQYYQDLKVGPIVGEPVPGTGTTVMGVDSQVYHGIGYMFPYQPLRTLDGNLYENLELQPDIAVFNTPSEIATGKDNQLDAAIKEALKSI